MPSSTPPPRHHSAEARAAASTTPAPAPAPTTPPIPTPSSPPPPPTDRNNQEPDPYPTPCPFCRISTAYPPPPLWPSPLQTVPTSPPPTLVSPPCHLLLSTPHTLAFLDIMPMSPGHVLLTTRAHFPQLSDVDGAAATDIGFWMPVVSRALRRVLGVRDWNVVQNNGARAAQVVPHVHFHFIPRYAEGAAAAPRRRGRGREGSTGKGQGQGAGEAEAGGSVDYRDGWAMRRSWRMFGRGTREELDDEEGAEVAERIREGLRREVEALGVREKL